ncbi:PPOX class F420-dependent enzyme [Parafrankia colletiae]|uniref:PPOX class F420-dependent enzyme n=1 Tax=Parafrankia colletiae TaxID=573497 RepID=A0A1S1R6D0_9ACTN|nr:PPOX class F420-dependent oxidoreductase [Parafrankia colletiae]MCK9905139.1 PPOX class F420-dependent oxidoreductase [Frankia sp. Cpl3]OHV41467.1 PPOX class F420-dependent enzyme [Parafrankia colletiae]
MTRPAQAEIPASHLDLLTQPLTAVLTTIGADGRPQSTAVWYLFHGSTLQTSMITTRQKYKNLLRKPVAGLFILDPANPFRTLEIRADVELTPDPSKELLPLFAKHYGVDETMLNLPGTERVAATLHPIRVVVNG